MPNFWTLEICGCSQIFKIFVNLYIYIFIYLFLYIYLFIVCSESRCVLLLRCVDFVSVSRLSLKCTVVSLHSTVKQRMKCNFRRVFNCLIKFLLTMVLSTEERVFLVEYVLRAGNRYTDLVRFLSVGSSKICSVS
jgi:hypothetical protein